MGLLLRLCPCPPSRVSTDVLGLEPAPNNGTHGSLNHILKVAPFQPARLLEVTKPEPLQLPTSEDQHHLLGCSCEQQVRVYTHTTNTHRVTHQQNTQTYIHTEPTHKQTLTPTHANQPNQHKNTHTNTHIYTNTHTIT